ncbi:HAMP domain-containing protein [Hydrogenobacter hydrogenophilus]|uniref:histidine kinase n=1 Tax=Hydrogenobacter hydrogenophilus TaxID=35835 RepID=A0A285P916_9AQUI|nr:HAMP domain-containing protein [Hydrogenobacter hydrogenophilus]SNZ16626.1 two-component system, NtrC family, nitrogen regulation sensor histidine kinase NtrY [Hydrogenobacter hydrogenophilus]
MKLYLTFVAFFLTFLGINIVILDNLRKVWHVGFPLILFVINIDLLVLVIVFAIFFRKFIKVYIEGSRKKLRKKLSNALFLYILIPVIFLNFATSVILLQSTKTLISSQLKDIAQKSEILYQALRDREREKIKLYKEFFTFLVSRGEDPRSYLSGLKEIENITPAQNCMESIEESAVIMCVGKYKIALKRDKDTLKNINSLYDVSKQLRNIVKSKDIISGIYLYFLVLITLITSLASVWFGNLVARHISLPLERLSSKVKEISKGNFSIKVHVPNTGDEIQELSEAFERMREELRKIYTKLENEKKVLEELINALPVGVAYVHQDGRVMVNASFIKMFGQEVKSEEDIKNLKKNTYIKEVVIEHKEGKVYIYEDIQPIILSERFKTWQYAVKRIAHEIKNPLTPISLNLERIVRLLEKEPTDKQKITESISLILEEINRIKDIVNKFRDLSVEREPKVEELSLRQLIEEVSKLYAGLSVEVSGDKRIYADRDMLKDMFLNLFNNSIEWGARKVRINIDEDVMEYVDDGRGIEKGKEGVIFIPYHSENPQGMGLGLAVVKNIVQVHGWSVKAVYDPKGFHLVVEFKPT